MLAPMLAQDFHIGNVHRTRHLLVHQLYELDATACQLASHLPTRLQYMRSKAWRMWGACTTLVLRCAQLDDDVGLPVGHLA